MFAIGLMLGIGVGCLLGTVAFRGEQSLQKDAADQPAGGPSGRAADRPVATANGPDHEQKSEITNMPAVAAAAGREGAPREKTAGASILKEKGNGKVSGKVIDINNQPVADVLITIKGWGMPISGKTNDAYASPRSLDDAIRDATRNFERDESVTWRAKTGAGGAFLFDSLPDDRFAVYARKTGFEIEAKNEARTQLRVGADVTFIAVELIEVPVVVRMPDGSAPAGAKINGYRDENGSSRSFYEYWTPDAPTLKAIPGSYYLGASIDAGRDRDALSAEGKRFLFESGKPPAPVVLELREQLKITGRFIYEDPDERHSAIVHIAPHSKENDADPQRIKLGGKTTNGSEEYVFNNMKAGIYDLGVCRDWRESVVFSATVNITNHSVNQDLRIPAMRAQDCFIVKATDQKGGAVMGLVFNFQGYAGAEYMNERASAVMKSGGEYWLRMPAAAGPAISDQSRRGISLQIQSPTHGTLTIPLEPAQREATVVFQDPATLRVQVSQTAGSGVEGALSVRIRDSKGFGFGFRDVDADGVAEIFPIVPGEYKLELLVRGGGSGRENQSMQAASTSVSIQSGQNNATLTCPAVCSFILRVPDSKIGDWVDLNSADGKVLTGTLRCKVAEGSMVQFQNIPNGDYRISHHTTNGTRREMSVRLPVNGEITLQPN